jgi:RNAse (barnase) inhibitor barstar
MNETEERDESLPTPAVQSLEMTPEAAAALVTLAASLGLEAIRIDLAGCQDKAGFLGRIAAALGFPAWFGDNWDALYDCLTDLSWRPGQGWVLILENVHDLRRAAPEVLDTALAIIGDAAVAWDERGLPLRVLVAA